MQLKDIVPFGRSFEEYTRMFSLTAADLRGTILGCGDGPASFNAEATQLGHRVISCDPVYAFTAAEIAARIDVVVPDMLVQLERHRANFLWNRFRDPQEVMDYRVAAMQKFLADYPAGRAQHRYQAAALPTLPFADQAFDLALVSHFLFLYSAHVDLAFHLAGITELLRVARELRIFPLLDLACQPSAFVEPVIEQCRAAGFSAEIRPVDYEFQRGANRMLVLRHVQ